LPLADPPLAGNKAQMPNIKNIHLNFLIWNLIVIWILIFGIFIIKTEICNSLVSKGIRSWQ